MKHQLRTWLVISLAVFISPNLIGQEFQRSLIFRLDYRLPHETKFFVVLHANGPLAVAKEIMSTEKGVNPIKTSISKLISREEQNLIFNLAANVDDFKLFQKGFNVDGTNAFMSFQNGTKTIQHECSNAGQWPAGEHTKMLLSELNKHLPTDMQIH